MAGGEPDWYKRRRRAGGAVEAEAECGDKVPFASKRRAVDAARYLRERGEKVHAYACGWCSSWHIGHGRDNLQPKVLKPRPRSFDAYDDDTSGYYAGLPDRLPD